MVSKPPRADDADPDAAYDRAVPSGVPERKALLMKTRTERGPRRPIPSPARTGGRP